MYDINDLRIGTKISLGDEPFVVLKSEHSKMGRAGAVLRTKLKNLATGAVLEKTFKGGDTIQEAELERTKARFLFSEGDSYNFMDETTYEQFSLSKQQLGSTTNYLVEDTVVTILNFQEKPINIELPVKVNLRVVKAPPGIRGDTAQGGTKEVVTETGLRVSTPLFVNEGETIRVDTRDGSYVERV